MQHGWLVYGLLAGGRPAREGWMGQWRRRKRRSGGAGQQSSGWMCGEDKILGGIECLSLLLFLDDAMSLLLEVVLFFSFCVELDLC